MQTCDAKNRILLSTCIGNIVKAFEPVIERLEYIDFLSYLDGICGYKCFLPLLVKPLIVNERL